MPGVLVCLDPDSPEVAFLLEHPHVVTIASAAYSEYPNVALVRAIAAQGGRDYQRILLAILKVPETEEGQLLNIGLYFTDLIQGRLDTYGDLVVVVDSPTFVVFEVETSQ